jgi:hypothetical protein
MVTTIVGLSTLIHVPRNERRILGMTLAPMSLALIYLVWIRGGQYRRFSDEFCKRQQSQLVCRALLGAYVVLSLLSWIAVPIWLGRKFG